MLIDDDKATNVFSKYIIRKHQCCESLTIYNAAQDALDDLKKRVNKKEDFPELIFLDLNMPRINGWDFLDDYTKNIEPINTSNTNLYILSTSMNPDDRKKGESINCIRKFLKKPISIDMLTNVIASLN